MNDPLVPVPDEVLQGWERGPLPAPDGSLRDGLNLAQANAQVQTLSVEVLALRAFVRDALADSRTIRLGDDDTIQAESLSGDLRVRGARLLP